MRQILPTIMLPSVSNNLTTDIQGAPWLGAAQEKIVPIDGLVSNRLLCRRHNSALSPLDMAAGGFFGALKSIYDDLADSGSLSRKGSWHLFSGEDIEAWFLKLAFGLFHSGNAARAGQKINSEQAINPAILARLVGRPIASPLGLYVLADAVNRAATPNQFGVLPLSCDSAERMVALRLWFMGLQGTILLDPGAIYGTDLTSHDVCRPSYLVLRNGRRAHHIVLTWPAAVPRKAVLFDQSGMIRGRRHAGGVRS
jgi:hypothetical protein